MSVFVGRKIIGAVCAAGMLIPVGAGAQTPVGIGTRVGAGEVEATSYEAQGRRDPFATLVVERTTPEAGDSPAPRAPGLAGVAIADVEIKGIIASGQNFLALVAGPAGVTYLARPNDRLHDAVVRRIDHDGVVFLAQVADSAGTVRGREVRKVLRPSTGGGR